MKSLVSAFLVLLAGLGSYFAPLGGTLTPNENAPTVTPIPFPTKGIAGEPFLTKSPEGSIFASWLERQGDVTSFMWSRLDGSAWSAPHPISSGSNWFVNWADVPSLAVASSGRMMAHWLERLGEDKYAYGIRFSVSSDAGKTWSTPAWLHEDRSPTEHGFASIEAAPDGFVAVWLDGNGYATERQEMAVHSRTIGFNGQLGKESVVDSRTCDCCPTTLTRLGDGRMVTLYRDRSGEEVRDIQASFWKNETWSKPVVLHEDEWKINACPVNGPSVHALGNEFAASWFTAAGGGPKLQALFSKSGGTAFGDPVRLDLGNAVGRVSVRMRTPTEAAALWIEGASSTPNGLVLKSFSADGAVSEAIQVSPISEGRSSGYPRLETDGKSLIAIWTVSSDPATIKTARISWN